MVTYKDLCINVLLRMGEDKNISDNTITQTSTITGYLKTIPTLLNDALNILATAGKYVNKSYEITVKPCQNALNGVKRDIVVMNEGKDVEYSAQGKAYSFSVQGTAKIEVYKDDLLVKTINNSSEEFTTYKGNIGAGVIKLVFKAGFYAFKNIAVYDIDFGTDEAVYEWTLYRKYDFNTLVNDFYALNSEEVVEDKWQPVRNVRFENTQDYYWESPKVMYLDNVTPATYRVHYFAYPQKLPAIIRDDYEIDIDPEVYAILPLFIEGKLRMISDEDYAMNVLSEFEQRRVELINSSTNTSKPKQMRFKMLRGVIK